MHAGRAIGRGSILLRPAMPLLHLRPSQPEPRRGIEGRADADGHGNGVRGSVLAARLDAAFEQHPRASVVALLGSEMVSVLGVYAAIAAAGASPPPELAAAFVLNRLARRARLPLELATAAGLLRVWPILGRVRLTALLAALPTLLRPVPTGALAKLAARARAVVDRYGIAYLLAARFVGVATTLGFFVALRLGTPLDHLLDALSALLGSASVSSAGSQIGRVLSTWAAAVLVSSSLYPLTIALVARVAPALATGADRIARQSRLLRLRLARWR